VGRFVSPGDAVTRGTAGQGMSDLVQHDLLDLVIGQVRHQVGRTRDARLVVMTASQTRTGVVQPE
jgi:hypothetical protein